jgi:hypothetical protein
VSNVLYHRDVHVHVRVPPHANAAPSAMIVTTKPSDRSESADVCARSPGHRITPLWLSLGIVEEQATRE